MSEGLHRKFEVKRVLDPSGKHAGCEYFVLDPQHDPIARNVLALYSAASRPEYPELADDLDAWLDRLGRP